jgi:hypothetical protein
LIGGWAGYVGSKRVEPSEGIETWLIVTVGAVLGFLAAMLLLWVDWRRYRIAAGLSKALSIRARILIGLGAGVLAIVLMCAGVMFWP